MAVRVIVANSHIMADLCRDQLRLSPRECVIVNTNDLDYMRLLVGLRLEPEEVALVYSRPRPGDYHYSWLSGRYGLDVAQELRMRGADPDDCGRIEV